MKDFKNEYMSIPPQDDRLGRLAEEYHRRCEEYDRQICAFFCNGVAVPRSPYEVSETLRNARHVLHDISDREGYSVEYLKRAIKDIRVRGV